jgi:hypothetical protein
MHRTIVRTAAALLAGLAIALLSLAFESAMIPGQMALVQMQTSTGGVGYEPASFAGGRAQLLDRRGTPRHGWQDPGPRRCHR